MDTINLRNNECHNILERFRLISMINFNDYGIKCRAVKES